MRDFRLPEGWKLEAKSTARGRGRGRGADAGLPTAGGLEIGSEVNRYKFFIIKYISLYFINACNTRNFNLVTSILKEIMLKYIINL
ncbi:hypothetical protein L1987_11617 [Smallanthus sonchifolius]|uniref:Uncharacterized protein n=1 Tax=Smallanthus sonchifolius TaxID=185202 RepID=A0ACB9JCC6_9ASTR|nr:hypothetical protein L1987_11617 [Smallanthus sonchifolius]